MSEASGIPSWCRVGAKVVCIDAWSTRTDNMPELVEGAVYVIAAVRPWRGKHRPEWAGLMGLVLEGVHRRWRGDRSDDWPFDFNRFRPLVTRSQEQDVAIFRPILDQVPVAA